MKRTLREELQLILGTIDSEKARWLCRRVGAATITEPPITKEVVLVQNSRGERWGVVFEDHMKPLVLPEGIAKLVAEEDPS